MCFGFNSAQKGDFLNNAMILSGRLLTLLALRPRAWDLNIEAISKAIAKNSYFQNLSRLAEGNVICFVTVLLRGTSKNLTDEYF